MLCAVLLVCFKVQPLRTRGEKLLRDVGMGTFDCHLSGPCQLAGLALWTDEPCVWSSFKGSLFTPDLCSPWLLWWTVIASACGQSTGAGAVRRPALQHLQSRSSSMVPWAGPGSTRRRYVLVQ